MTKTQFYHLVVGDIVLYSFKNVRIIMKITRKLADYYYAEVLTSNDASHRKRDPFTLTEAYYYTFLGKENDKLTNILYF